MELVWVPARINLIYETGVPAHIKGVEINEFVDKLLSLSGDISDKGTLKTAGLLVVPARSKF